MNTVEMLDELQNKALHDEKLKNRFLETKKEEDALGAFCRVCRELGYDIYPMDVIQAGDEFYAAMKRSTNGGGENSPKLEGEDDLYEMFFASMEQMEEMDMESTLKDLKERRSIRAYKPEQIKEEELQKILEAGTYAPTGMGMQSPKIVVVQDKETRDYLSELNAKYLGSDSDPFYGAPTVLVVLASRARPTCVEDGSLVMGNLMNAAYAAGVGSCWIHRAREVFDSEEGKALLKKWGIEGDYIGVGHCILGYPADGAVPQAKPRKDDYVVYVR